MTIHHDKLAYGKLDPLKEDVSDEKLMEMLKILNGQQKDVEELARGNAEGKDKNDK